MPQQISARDIPIYQHFLFSEDDAWLREAASKKAMKLPKHCSLELRMERHKSLVAYERFRKVVAQHFHYQGPDGRNGTSKSGMAKAINAWVKKALDFDIEDADPRQLRVLTMVRDAVSHVIEEGEARQWTRKAIKLKIREVVFTLGKVFSFGHGMNQ